MKKLSAMIVLILALALVFTGCGKEKETVSDEPFSYSLYHDENGRWEGVNANEVVTLCEYKGIPLAAEDITPDEAEIQSNIDSVLEQYAEQVEVLDAVVLDGDTVNIDYVGSIDGVEFAGGNTNGAGTDVTIGVTQYIDDFLEQLIGHVPGDTFDVEVTFPDPYQNNPDLAGKDAVFVTTINCIKKSVVPELTDETVRTYLADEYGVSTADEFRAYLKDSLAKQMRYDAANTYLTLNSGAETLPEKVIEYQKLSLKDYYTQYAAYYSMELDSFISSAFGAESMEDLYTQYAAEMHDSAVQSLIIQAIAENENIEASDAEVVAFFAENAGAEDISEYEATYGMNYLKMIVMQNKVLDFVTENAVIE